MKYVDLDNGMRVAVCGSDVGVYSQCDDGFGNKHYELAANTLSLIGGQNLPIAQAIAALVEKLEEPNEPA